MIGQFSIKPTNAKKVYVYGLFADNTLMYCGIDNFLNITSFRNLQSNPVFDINKEYMVCIFSCHEDMTSARNAQAEIIKMYSPDKCPMMNLVHQKRKRYVKCVETGETWETANSACKSLGISPGVMYPHLKGVPGHLSIRGKHYSYIYEGDNA